MPNGPLSLPARLYLLAWDSTRSEATGAPQPHHLVRAGALLDLARRGLLTDDDGIATPVDLDARAGDAVLDGLLELVRESRPHGWRTWVTLRARVTLDAVREQLTADGYLRAEKHRVLGVFPTVEYTLDREAVVETLREETRQVLRGPLPVAEVSERDAAVAVLMDALEPRTVAPDKGRAPGHGQRVDELTDRAAAAAPALGKVVREVRAALAAAVPSVPTASSSPGPSTRGW
ncbi:GOLPH3/VPS74 family protein [Streptomyces sp. NPDC001658]